MRGGFEALGCCGELTPQIARAAAGSRESMRAFLSWAAATARPDEGAPKVLLAIAALTEAAWIEGTLYIDVAGDDSTTKLSIFADFGFGIRERILPLARFDVPFDEFVRAVRLAPKLIAPLESAETATSLVLTPPDVRVGDPVEVPITIAESSLTEAVTSPPPAAPDQSGVHTHPTVRRMVAIRPEARRSSNDD